MLSMFGQRSAGTLTLRERRALTHSRNLALPEGLTLVGGQVFPGSFVNSRLVESLFADCRQFMFWVFKNVEAQVETALRFGERPSLTDDEVISITFRLCKEEFGVKGAISLTEQQKSKLAMRLKYDYDASNGQISRSTGLQPRIVDEMFPLAAPDSSSK